MRLSSSFAFLALALPTLAFLNPRATGHKAIIAKRAHARPSDGLPVPKRSLAEQEDMSSIGEFSERDEEDFGGFDERAFWDDSNDHIEKRAVTCPAGYKYRVIREDFSKAPYDTKLWDYEWGNKSMMAWDKTKKVLKIAVTKDNENTVFASKLHWLPGSSFTVVTKPADAPGVCTPYIFYEEQGSDEVDLEFVGSDGKSIQTVVWQKAIRQASSYDGAFGIDSQKGYNTYNIRWNANDVQLWVNNKWVRTHQRNGDAWALDPLRMKWGPWAVYGYGGWAGQLDYSKRPYSIVWTKAIKVAGCSK